MMIDESAKRLERLTLWVFGVLGAVSLIFFVLWSSISDPIAWLYNRVGHPVDAVRDGLYVYYLRRLTWPTLAFSAAACGFSSLLRLRPGLLSEARRESPDIDPVLAVLLFSTLALYFEILTIRWLGSELRLMAYLKNLTLICAFLGLGAGMMRQDQEPHLLPYFPILLACLVFAGTSPHGRILGRMDIPATGLFFWDQRISDFGLRTPVFYAYVTTFIALQTAFFVPLGQAIAVWLRRLPPLKGYSVNIAGSLAGLWVFSLFSFFYLPSWGQFLAGIAIYLWAAKAVHQARTWRVEAALCGIALLCVLFGDMGSYWSPYHKIDMAPVYLDRACGAVVFHKERVTGSIPWGYRIFRNDLPLVEAVDTSEQFIAQHPEFKTCRDTSIWRNVLPFELIPPAGKNVLIVGSGPGNDVAAALNHGAAHVDAVEIDPGYVRMGRRFHPEHPYSDPRVTVTVDDARAFFHQTSKKFDFVFLASLDSQMLLSGMSSLRMDNYVYTLQSLQAIRALLAPDGVVGVVHWATSYPNIDARFRTMLHLTFPENPVRSPFPGVYLAGPGLARYGSSLPPDTSKTEETSLANVPTDNWPFLYLQKRHIPRIFIFLGAVLVALSFFLASRSGGTLRKFDFGFMFLGAGFMLLETKGVTQMSLLYGTTWFVNTVVFSVVLLVILLANLMSERLRGFPERWVFAALGATLLGGYFFDVGSLFRLAPLARHSAAAVVLGLPFFFAAIIFAEKFKKTPQAVLGVALGSNLIGSTLGGTLEYVSLLYGFRFLSLVALAFYCAAYFFFVSRRGAEPA